MSSDALLTQLNTHRRTLSLPMGPLSYLEWPGAEPVLLLHGLADHGLVLAELAAALGDRYHCVAPDLRGHGDSAKPAQGYRCTDLVADLMALLAHLGWPSAHLVAHSWAAKVAVVWARQQPAQVQSLTLIDPFFINRLPGWMRLTFPILYRTLPFLKTMGPFASYEEAEAVAKTLKQYRGWRPLQAAVFQQSMEQRPDGQWGSKFAIAARNGVFADVLQVAGLTTTVAVPTLLLQPLAGLNRTDWQLRPYRRHLPQLQIQAIPGNHWPFLVAPTACQQAVADFLAQQAATR